MIDEKTAENIGFEKGKLVRAIRKLLIDNGQPVESVKWYEDKFTFIALCKNLEELQSKYTTRKHERGCIVSKDKIPQDTGTVAEHPSSKKIFKDVRKACKKGKRLKVKVKGEAKKLKFSSPTREAIKSREAGKAMSDEKVNEGTLVAQLNKEPEIHLKNKDGVVEEAVPVVYGFGPKHNNQSLTLFVPRSSADEVMNKLNEIFATGAILIS